MDDTLYKNLNFPQKQPPEVFYKKMFLKISQNSEENTYTNSLFFNKSAGRY